MGQDELESFGEKQVLAVFRRTRPDGDFLYTTEQSIAATVFCTLSLVHGGIYTMQTLPPALGQVISRYISEHDIRGDSPEKLRAALLARFDKDIPVEMMRELNEAISMISREGGVETAEALARSVGGRPAPLASTTILPPKTSKGASARNRKN